VRAVAVARRRLTVSPVRLDDEERGRMAAFGAIYLERKQELSVPVEYGESVTAAALGLLTAIYSPTVPPPAREE
jgi:hypothetical protein